MGVLLTWVVLSVGPIACANQENATGPQSKRRKLEPISDATQSLDQEKVVAVRHLMQLTGTAKVGEEMMAPIMQQIRTMIATAVPAEDRQKFTDDFAGKFRTHFDAKYLVDAIIPIYVRHLSLGDIQALTQFYESPVGQRFVNALPQISKESQTVGAQLGQKAVLDTLREMSDQYPDLRGVLPPDDSVPKESHAAVPGESAAPVPSTNEK